MNIPMLTLFIFFRLLFLLGCSVWVSIMTTVILFVALSLTPLHASAPQFAYRVPRNYPDNQIYQDYSTATNGELIDAAARKAVTLDKGSQCSFDNKNIISAGSLKEGEITNSLDSDAAAVPLTLTCRTADSHRPQMITDGNTRTYWLSNGSNPLSKLVIDLNITYQVSVNRIILLLWRLLPLYFKTIWSSNRSDSV